MVVFLLCSPGGYLELSYQLCSLCCSPDKKYVTVDEKTRNIGDHNLQTTLNCISCTMFTIII